MLTRNILVLENVGNLEPNFRTYLNENHKNDDLNIIYNLSISEDEEDVREENQKKILDGLSKADTLCVSSTFANREQFSSILQLLLNFENLKEVRIHYLYTQNDGSFRDLLNYDITEENKTHMVSLMNQCIVSEIFINEFELKNDKGSFFKKFRYTFDVVPMYYNDIHNVFWHRRQPAAPWLNDFMYIDKPGTTPLDLQMNQLQEFIDVNTQKINDIDALSESKDTTKKIRTKPLGKFVPNNKLALVLDKKYAGQLASFLEEAETLVKNQLELCKEHDFGDQEELIKEKTEWLQLLDKIKLL